LLGLFSHELLDTRRWDNPQQLGSAIFEWIEAWYNPRRRHTSIGMLAPVEYEHQHQLSRQHSLHTAADGAA
jgi:transposase InsO family protein